MNRTVGIAMVEKVRNKITTVRKNIIHVLLTLAAYLVLCIIGNIKST